MRASHYFIAIPLKREIKDELARWQNDLNQHLPYQQWTYKEDFHLTLKFLGSVPNGSLEKLKSELHLLESSPSFQLYISGLAHFGSPKHPRVLFADVVQSKALSQLEQNVEKCAQSVRIPREKRAFHPHITLGKKWDGLPKKSVLQSFVQQYKQENFHMLVDEVVLYKIYPEKQPKYVCESTYRLSQ